jgi:MraZ protein
LSFRGTFDHALDAKHRLTIPAKFRGSLAGTVVVAASPEIEAGSPRAISIWPPQDYEDYMASILKDLNPGTPKARELKRFFFNTSFDVELDNANRVMLPPELMRYAGLDKEVVVTGSGECLEVWDRARYRDNLEQVTNRIPEIAASLGDTT